MPHDIAPVPLRHFLAAGALALVGVEFGLVPGTRFVWGPALWRYFPCPAAVALAVALVAWATWPAGRRGVRLALEGAVRALLRAGVTARAGAALGLVLLLFVLRPRLIFGDSQILWYAMVHAPSLYFFPDVGATFFIQAGYRVGQRLGLGGRALVEALACACAPIAVFALARAARYLAPNARRAGWLVALALGTGVVRIFAGHIEVYAYVLAAAMLYLWAGLAYLQRRSHFSAPCLALGVGIWIHLQFLALVPSLVFVLFEGLAVRTTGSLARRLLVGGLLTLAPLTLFLALVSLAAGPGDLARALDKLVRVSTAAGSGVDSDVWIRVFESAGPGTRYRLLSPGHLRYLANAFFVLAPVAPWLGVWLIAHRRPGLLASPESRFLAVGLAPLGLYALAIRPVYGPYDWDLFSLTAVWLSISVGSALARTERDGVFDDLAALAVGIAALTTALPMIAIGVAARADRGPFSPEPPVLGETFNQSFERRVAPWIR